MPELIMAKIKEDGPTKGLTSIPIRCALEMIMAPGSAIPGTPASDINPMEIPSKQGLR